MSTATLPLSLFALPFSTIVCGVIVSRCDWDGARKLKAIPTLLAVNIVVCCIWHVALSMQFLYGPVITGPTMNAIVIVLNLTDLVSAWCMEICYLVRLRAFITNKRRANYLWGLLLICLLYSFCDIFGIMALYNAINLTFYNEYLYAVNLMLAASNLVVHLILVAQIYKALQLRKVKVPLFSIFGPAMTNVLFFAMSIWGLVDANLGLPAVWTPWMLDVSCLSLRLPF